MIIILDSESNPSLSNREEYHVKETDVGITEYLSTHEGYTGIIKQRYTEA